MFFGEINDLRWIYHRQKYEISNIGNQIDLNDAFHVKHSINSLDLKLKSEFYKSQFELKIDSHSLSGA